MARRRGRMIGLIALAALALSGCVTAPREGFTPIATADAPRFDALAFFERRGAGRGVLSKVLSGTVPVRVTSEGTLAPDGTLTLVQQIEEGEKPPRTREWTLRETLTGRYVGTLTEAVGPVEAQAEGNRLSISYAMDGGFQVDQVLTLADDGQSAHNELRVTMLGATVAVLVEQIERE